MSEISSKKGIGIIIVLSIVLIFFLSVGIIKDKQIQNENSEDYNEWIQSKKEATSTSDKSSDEQKEKIQNDSASMNSKQNTDIYTKIKNKNNIKVLVLGDGLALSVGRNSEAGIWQDGFKSAIESKLGCKTEMVSLAQNKSTTNEGVQVVSTTNDLSEYDLVITCFGHNDNISKVDIKSFEDNYNKIINKVKQANNNVTIIAVIPNTLDRDNQYRKKIIEISKNSKIETADTKAAFEAYGASEKKLVKDSLPNDTGYQVYTKTIYDALAKNIK